METLNLDNKLLKPIKNKLENSINILTKNAILTGKESEITLKIGISAIKKDDKDFNEYIEPCYEYQLVEKIKESKGTYKGNLGFNYSIELDKQNNITVKQINEQQSLFDREED